jgi:hypothetical protein
MASPHSSSPQPDPAAASPTAGDEAAPIRSFSISYLIAVLFLVSQATFVLHAYFSDARPRLLTPVEGLTRYELHATFAQRALTEEEIRRRYGVPTRDESALTASTLCRAVTHREKPIPLARALYVRLRTQEADGTEGFWLWPQE